MKGVEPLLFVLKGLCARVSARLQGRAQAVRQLKLTLLLDRSIAALRGAAPSIDYELRLPTPIHRAEEMERILSARSKRLQLEAPILAVRLTADDVTEAPALQLDLSRVLQGAGGSRNQGAEALPVLLAEISAEIGATRVGVLREVPSHIPEGKSALQMPVLGAARHDEQHHTHEKANKKGKRTARNQAALYEAASYEQRSFFQLIQERKAKGSSVRSEKKDELTEIKLQPTRLLPKPVPLTVKLERGATLVVGSRLFTLSEARFERRLSEIEWWSATAISRDYWRLWLTSPSGGCAALAFVERKTGKRYLQALYD
jgi:protein ImuB